MAKIGERIREVREFRGYSQEELCNKLKEKGLTFSREIISKMETGNRKIGIDEMKAIADVCDVTIDFFLEEEDDETLVTLFRRERELEQEEEFILDDIYTAVELILAQEELKNSVR